MSCNFLLFFFVFFYWSQFNTPTPVGFEKQPKVHFINDEFCTASTCDLIFRLPTINDGFGGVSFLAVAS